MTFLNSAILAALTLGLLPILIHLLNRQRYKRVEFPTLRFLHELQRQKMRQVRIRQIILLALRTLAILFLVLALARPVLKSTAGLLPGVGARTTAVLILDRSASMRTETPAGTRFREVQTRAQEILSSLADGDEAQIIWADGDGERFPETPTPQIRLLRETVVDALPTLRGGNLVAAIRQAREIVGQSQNLHKEVYVLSDFSASAWPEEMPQTPLLPSDVRLFLLPIDGSAARNIGITDAAVISRIITPNRPVTVNVGVHNSGDTQAADRIISIYAGGRRVAQTRVTLAAGESRELQIRFVPEAAGDQVAYARVEEADDFAADDQRFFVLRVPSRLNVAVAGGEGPARTLTALALNPGADPNFFLNVREWTPAQLEGEDWSTLDAMVIVDAAQFNSGFGARLRGFVEAGKGVLVIPGPGAATADYAGWLTTLGLPLPGELWQSAGGAARWSNIDLKHPLFEGLFEDKPASISPEITRLLRTASGGTATDVIATSMGAPFLLEAKVGRGRALLMTSSPDPAWSTLYRTGIFPPLMVSSAAYLAGVGTSGTDYQLTVGVPAQLAFAGTPGDQPFELRGDQTLVPAVQSAAAGYQLLISSLNTPGAYELWQGSRRIAAVAVNPPPRETLIQAVPESGYKDIVGGQVMFLDDRASVQSAIMEGRFGRELWKLCLFVALALLLAEMLLGRVGKREAAVA